MMHDGVRVGKTPRDSDLGLQRLTNSTGLSLSVLANGCIFAVEHHHARGCTLINQVLGSPIDGGIGRVYLRIGAPRPRIAQVYGPRAKVQFGAANDRIVWAGQSDDVQHRLILWLHPEENLWFWHLEIINLSQSDLPCDAILVQDLGLGDRPFLMNNEAYASQYIDHYMASDPQLGPVIMSRQNQAQHGAHPWALHACISGAAGYATDAMQLFGPQYRDAEDIECLIGTDLPSQRLQHELACAVIQSRSITLKPGASGAWIFLGLYEPDHREASSESDLARISAAQRHLRKFAQCNVALRTPVRSVVQDAPPLAVEAMHDEEIAERYPVRRREEAEDELLSFFVPDSVHNRHVVLREKERRVRRRHGTLLRTGQCLLPDEATMCATFWMHGCFGAQLTIGNTSLHKLFSVSRDPYNITRASGLRILADGGAGWRLLTVPSAFEIGLSDCRWIYHVGDRTIIVHAIASGDEPAIQWKISVAGAPCRFLVFGNLVLGEREFEHAGHIEINAANACFTFRPESNGMWAHRYPDAEYRLLVSTPAAVDAIGADELLYADRMPRAGGYAVIQSRATNELAFAVVGSLKCADEAAALAAKYATDVDIPAMLAPAAAYWKRVTRGLRITGPHADVSALDTIFPWLAHNAIVHLTVPHGLEQYTGAAWGTRDVCQGPVEFLLALEHDEAVREVLRIVFAQQYESRGDWPQWFMLKPYVQIQDLHSHGDVIIWPLKALCDYLECTNDLAFLDEEIAWRCDEGLAPTARKDSIAAHVRKLIDTVVSRFIPGTRLLKYGEGDWNDSLQPVDPRMRECMVSSWTVALLYQQMNRYAEVLRRAGRAAEAEPLARLAAEMRLDFNRHLISDDVVAGYVVFEPQGKRSELVLHPSDRKTGVRYSLLPMTQSIIGELFTAEQTQHHIRLIREHLLYPDGARLMDGPIEYRGGPERIFRRAETAAFFGREIGLMFTPIFATAKHSPCLAKLMSCGTPYCW
ncbi:cellobiose phosphorylase [Hyphomicrobium sp.]|uniref:GH36-type glycosyl hydrolase domain-containing protein n=1 Tax=Hyphomicrobium sp. TaxID=82 RepID=UPI0025BAD783|nr:cellobiose phosphorylase [Hyphomicrobium sp.]